MDWVRIILSIEYESININNCRYKKEQNNTEDMSSEIQIHIRVCDISLIGLIFPISLVYQEGQRGSPTAALEFHFIETKHYQQWL